MRYWFDGKRNGIFNLILKSYLIMVIAIYLFTKGIDRYILIAFVTLGLVAAWLLTRKEFKKRLHGLKVEDSTTVWLKAQLDPKNISFKTSIKTKRGDIDIYIPSLQIVIDVKSFGKIDDRSTSLKIQNSLINQMSFVGAKTAILWLPNTRSKEIVCLSENIFVVAGRKNLINALGINK